MPTASRVTRTMKILVKICTSKPLKNSGIRGDMTASKQ